jgi:hypothetical protein
MSSAMNRAMLAGTAAFLAFVLIGCGGGNGNYQSLAVTPTIAVTPATANVQAGSSQQFVATVTNSLDDTVTWEVNGVIGGNMLTGTIGVNGVYTAPPVVPSPPNVTVTAILNAATNYSANSILAITTAVFNNSSLQGNYILSLKGIAADGSPFYALGAVTANGNGNITGGEEDLNDANSGYTHAASVTGDYAVGPDGRGTLNLNSSLGSFSYAIALRATNNAGLNEIDKAVFNATGSLESQSGGVTAPSGNYAFGFTGTSSACEALNSTGIFGWSSGAVGGQQDVNCAGMITQSQAQSGSYAGIDSMGRGTGSFSANTGSSNFDYYVISANRYRFLCRDSGTAFLGSADLQTQTTFATSDFNGNYIIASSASSPGAFAGSLALINASGGNIPAGYLDINSTGTFNSYNLTGAYSLSANGYVNGTLNTPAAAFPFSMYLVSPAQGYYLDLRTDISGSGTVYAQNLTLATEGNLSWAGSYATEQFGYYVGSGVISPGNSTTVGGQISSNGSGALSGTLDINDPGGLFPGLPLQGSYSMGVSILGRGTAKITSSDGTRNYIAYIIDQQRVELLETDSSITAVGDAIRQF